MGLKLSKIDFVPYIPRFGGNRERWNKGEELDPCIVEIKALSYGDARRIAKAMANGGKLTDEENIRYFLDHVGPIHNLCVGETAVTSGKQLMELEEQIDPDFMGEINDALVNRQRLEEGVKKSSG